MRNPYPENSPAWVLFEQLMRLEASAEKADRYALTNHDESTQMRKQAEQFREALATLKGKRR